MTLGDLLPIGTYLHSSLTESQFQAECGLGWVLADGRVATGSRWSTLTGNANLPDTRGTFLRAKNNGSTRNPDGELGLGVYTADKYTSHNHAQTYSNGSSTTETRISDGGSGFTLSSAHIGSSSASVGNGTGSLTNSQKTSSTGGNETAPKSIITNIFIRIN